MLSEGYNNTVRRVGISAAVVLTVVAVSAGAPVTPNETITFEPGLRHAREGTVTVTDIDCSKIMYAEDETATCTARFENKSDRNRDGRAVAVLHYDVDSSRQVGRAAIQLAPGEHQQWKLSFSVGPETYGRGIEVKYIEDGNEIDSWREFFSVAAEWLRVQMHVYAQDPWALYFNQVHQFAFEATDFGEQPVFAEQYVNGQSGYGGNYSNRQRLFADLSNKGVKCTIYQNFAPCGPAGWEVIRKHPEFILYDVNGQPAVDPIYHTGQPNPMQLASPIETGPKRKPTKPYLDHQYVPWQRTVINAANLDAIIYEADCMKEHARFLGFNGVYVDGNWGVLAGYGYDGKPNVPGGKEEHYAGISARNHRVYSEMMKRDDPTFGTWFNWGKHGCEYGRRQGWKNYVGSGIEGDVNDHALRAVTDWNNVTLLSEAQTFLYSKGDGAHCVPERCLHEWLLGERDFAVQKYGANVVVGYVGVGPVSSPGTEPGRSKWGWATINYFASQAIASQMHLAGWYSPAWRPTTQFMTRYSRFLWARDIKALPEAQTYVLVRSQESLFRKRLIYRRATDSGYDLIIHLVRVPPMDKWDLVWPVEPARLESAQLRLALPEPGAHIATIRAMRPFYFEEPQQPVSRPMDAARADPNGFLSVPEFKYYTMVVCRVVCREE